MIIFLASIIPIISIGSTPNVNGHSADEILVTMKSHQMTLQYAITNNYFRYGVNPTTAQPNLPNIINGHSSADEIKIIVGSQEKTLQQAIDLLSSNPRIFCSGGSSTPSINIGHDSYKISINGNTKTLQQAINDGGLCGCVSKTCGMLRKQCDSWDNGCGGTVTCSTCPSSRTCSNGVCIVTTGTWKFIKEDSCVSIKGRVFCPGSQSRDNWQI